MLLNNICSRCVLDSTVPEIIYDQSGECNYCKIHDQLENIYPKGVAGEKKLEALVKKIKSAGKSKKYNCLIGVSGGTDSTYTLYFAKKILGLNPLAVHFDNGWNSEIAVENIKNATKTLDIDLYTLVADWEEFKDLQIAFLKSSTPDAEVPTDYVIISVLYYIAAKENIKFMIEGQSFRAEGTTPIGWTYHDGKYLKTVHRKYGTKKIKSFPILSISKLFYYTFIKKIKPIRPLEYIDYSKEMAKEVIKSELKWKDTGGHHHESIYTKFFQSYYLVNKFDIDKRKRELSAKIRSGLIKRESALDALKIPYYVEDGLIDYVKHKLELSTEEFSNIMSNSAKSFLEYPNQYNIINLLRPFIRIACNLHLLPPIFYYKYGTDHSSAILNHWKKFNAKR